MAPPATSAALDNDPTVQLFRNFIRKEDNAKREWKVRALRNKNYYQGRCEYFADAYGVNLMMDPGFAQGTINIPIFSQLVDRAAATIMAEKSTWRAAQLGGSYDDAYRAEAASMGLQQFETQNTVQMNNLSIARMMQIMGMGFKRLYLDEDFVPVEAENEKLEMYVQFKNEELAKNGKPPLQIASVTQAAEGRSRAFLKLPVIREGTISPLSFIVPTGARNLSDCNVFVVFEIRSLDWLRAYFPDADLENLRGDNIEDIHNASPSGNVTYGKYNAGYGQQTLDSFSSSANVCMVYDCWLKMADGNYQHMMFAGRELKVLLKAEVVRFHPYVEYRGILDTDNKFWCDILCDRIADTQRHLVKFTKDVLTGFAEGIKSAWIFPDNIRTNPTNEWNQVFMEPARLAGAIRRIDPPTGSQQMALQLISKLESDMYNVFGLSDASRGLLKSHTTADATSMVMTSDNNTFKPFREGIDWGERQKCQKVLRMMQDIYDEPRLIAMTDSQSGAVLSRVIRGADFYGVTDVQVVDVIDFPKDAKTRIDYAIQLVQAGMFAADPNAMNDWVRFGISLPPKVSSEVFEEKRARDIIELIKQGFVVPSGMVMPNTTSQETDGQAEPTPMIFYGPEPMAGYMPGDRIVTPIDIQEIHINMIVESARQGEFSPQVMQMAMMLLQERQNVLNAEQKEAEAAQMELIAKESMAKQSWQLANMSAKAMIEQAQGKGSPLRKTSEVA